MPVLKLSPKGHRYGYIPAPPKATDNGFPTRLITRSGDLPKQYFLTNPNPGRAVVGPTTDQGQQGSCDGHLSRSMGERLYLRWKPNIPFVQFSPAYAYAQERILEGTFDQGDVGAMISTAMSVPDPKAQGGSGYCPLLVMPYDETVWNVKPNAGQIAAAQRYPGGAYHSIGNIIANMKSCIVSGYSFGIGISVYDSFEGDQAAADGLIPYPNRNTEALQGGHALHAGIGFDDSIQCPNSPNPGAVWFQNSWSVKWGRKCPVSTDPGGFGLISYDFLMDYSLTSDVRMAHLGSAW